MTYVNNYKIAFKGLSGSTTTIDPATGEEIVTNVNSINVPIGQLPRMAGQQEIIDTKFVDVEVENSINAIFDYEKTKFIPKMRNDSDCKNIIYNINFLERNAATVASPLIPGEPTTPLTYLTNTFWGSDLGDLNKKFVYDDLNFKKNVFTKSFLRLDFYDSDIGTSQRLLSFITLYPNISKDAYAIIPTVGLIPQPDAYPLRFRLGNSIKDRTLNGEGFFMYYYKDEVLPTVPKNLYMKAVFANAKTGKAIRLMSGNNPTIGISDLAKTTIGTSDFNSLYTKYELVRTTEGYFYKIDKTYSQNVSETFATGDNTITVNLYEISAG
tara:strand:- start:4287 stop:5261 length:975 start_codon:yes stop_codon:yes gene_type:complete